jgi:hypothetical protein
MAVDLAQIVVSILLVLATLEDLPILSINAVGRIFPIEVGISPIQFGNF